MESTSFILFFIICFLIIIAFISNQLATESNKKKLQNKEFKSFVEIKKFPNIDEAEIARSFLTANSIAANIFTATGTADPALNFVQGNRLMVKEEDKEKALELLNNLK